MNTQSRDFPKSTNEKTGAILRAAWEMFAAYGMRKTSMQDIARAAGMSRPALYMYYKNKDDILRSMVEKVYADAKDQIREALSQDGDVRDVLQSAMETQGATLVEAMLSSPHADELASAAASTASEQWKIGETELSKIYADWLQTQADAGRITLDTSAHEMAEILTWSMKGLKSAGFDVVTYRARVAQLAHVFSQGLMPR